MEKSDFNLNKVVNLTTVLGAMGAFVSWLGFVTFFAVGFYFTTKSEISSLQQADKELVVKVNAVEKDLKSLLQEIKFDLVKKIDDSKDDTEKHFVRVEKALARVGDKIDAIK